MSPWVSSELNKVLWFLTIVLIPFTGPSIFITCPTEMESSQLWFNDLWNYSICPYLIQAARDGLQKNGLRSPFEEPAEWIIKTYPWKQDENDDTAHHNLNKIKLEDIQPYPGLRVQSPLSDPLSDMLLRLQVATSSEDSGQLSQQSH